MITKQNIQGIVKFKGAGEGEGVFIKIISKLT